jgi:signal transduction histidine kinase
MLLLGRLLTPSELALIGERAQVHLEMLAAQVLPSNASNATTLTESEQQTVVIRNFADVAGVPLVAMRIRVPRTISESGRHTVAYASIFLVGGGCVALLLLLVTLNRSVLEPLARLTEHAVAIGHSDDLTSRFDLKRADELGRLASEFDHMMVRLADARRQLVDQSFDAGLAEMSSGVLHNIGNALTPLSIKVTLLQEKLRAAPVADVEMVLTELDANPADSLRRADLHTFLGLASRELARAIVGVQGDLEAMEQQTDVIQRTLAEQMNFARSSRVIETVRLTELIEQSAAALPNAVRQRLSIENDAALESLGSIRLARTTLQRVFQMLMLHAAGASAGSDAERVRLQVAATIDAAAQGERLRILFRDGGTDIAPENLRRVFEKGFSLRANEKRTGVDLHWCANAINALGGSLHVESAGAGQGIAFHLVLPLERSGAAAALQAA